MSFKRLLPLLAFVVLGAAGWLAPAGVIAADGPFGVDIYVRGSMNDWSLDDPMAYVDGEDVYVAEIKLKGGLYAFKIASEDWATVDLGFADDGWVDLGIPEPVMQVSFNELWMFAPYTATYSFELDVADLGDMTVLVNCIRGCGGQPGVLYQAHVGGPDACDAFGARPGCDANFSLSARVYGDGSVKGEYTDRFAGGDGFHAVIDCLWVGFNDAWVSGYITQGTFDGQDLAGFPVATRVRDNTPSGVPDQISVSWVGDPTPCYFTPDYPLFDVYRGQVVVK